MARDGRSVHLSPIELRLLCTFLERPGHVFSRDDLLKALHGHDPALNSRSIDMQIARLRKSLNAGGETDIIRRAKDSGYSIDIGCSE